MQIQNHNSMVKTIGTADTWIIIVLCYFCSWTPSSFFIPPNFHLNTLCFYSKTLKEKFAQFKIRPLIMGAKNCENKRGVNISLYTVHVSLLLVHVPLYNIYIYPDCLRTASKVSPLMYFVDFWGNPWSCLWVDIHITNIPCQCFYDRGSYLCLHPSNFKFAVLNNF